MPDRSKEHKAEVNKRFKVAKCLNDAPNILNSIKFVAASIKW